MTVTNPTLIIEDSGGNTTATITADTAQATDPRREMARGQCTIPRSDWTSVSPDTVNDRFRIERPDGTTLIEGRYDDDTREGQTVTVTVVSYERDAVDAEKTGSNHVLPGTTDAAAVQDAIDAVPTLSAGTVDTLEQTVTIELANAARSKQIRKVQTVTGADVRYNPDRTVDYVADLGTDLGLVVSPASQNVVGEPRITRDVRDPVTHVKGYGAQDGPVQVTATGVADSYSGGRKVWREFEDTDIKSQARLQTIVDRLADGYDGEPRKLTVEARLVDVDIERGDTARVLLPDHGIDQRLEVIKLVETFGERGQEFVATLTNRVVDQDMAGPDQETLQRVSRGFEGFLDRDQTTSGWNAAGDGVPQTFKVVNWPDDIVSERVVELTVQGRAWRSPADADGHQHSVSVTHPSHTHDVTHPSHNHDVSVTHPTHDHDVSISTTSTDNSDLNAVVEESADSITDTIGTSWKSVDSIAVSSDVSEVRLLAAVQVTATNGDSTPALLARLRNPSTGNTYPETANYSFAWPNNFDGSNSDTPMAIMLSVPRNVNGDSIKFELRQGVTGDSDVTVSTYWAGIGKHNHDISSTETSDTSLGTTETSTSTDELGTTETSTAALGTTTSETTDSETDFAARVIDTFGGNTYYPTDVEIEVNNTVVTTLSGSPTSEWEATIDLSGQLTPGSNDIRATPTGQRGELNLHLASELFRRGPSSN